MSGHPKGFEGAGEFLNNSWLFAETIDRERQQTLKVARLISELEQDLSSETPQPDSEVKLAYLKQQWEIAREMTLDTLRSANDTMKVSENKLIQSCLLLQQCEEAHCRF